jgi:hypothetical protein
MDCFPLYRNGLLGFLEPLDVTLDGVFGHGSCVLQVLALSRKSREGGDFHRVASVFVSLENSGVFVDPLFPGLHACILNQMLQGDLSFRGAVLGPRNLSFFGGNHR